MNRSKITNEAFREVWNAMPNQDRVAETLGMSRGAVHSRAVRLRKMGFSLKKFTSRGNSKHNYEAITEVWNGCASTMEAAEKLNLDPNNLAATVSYMRKKGYNVKKMGAPISPPTDRNLKVWHLAMGGMRVAEIAERLNITRQRVYQILDQQRIVRKDDHCEDRVDLC